MNRLMQGARFLLHRLCRYLLSGWVDSLAWRMMAATSAGTSKAIVVVLLVLSFAFPIQGSQVSGAIARKDIHTASHKNRAESERLTCLAQNIVHEAGNELIIGRVAVGHVTLNRVKSKKYPADICAVVRQGGEVRNRCQFSWHCDGKPDISLEKIRRKHGESWKIAEDILSGVRWKDDPTDGATHFYSAMLHEPPEKRPTAWRKMKPPVWRLTMTPVGRIGDHLFFKPLATKGKPAVVEERSASR